MENEKNVATPPSPPRHQHLGIGSVDSKVFFVNIRGLRPTIEITTTRAKDLP